MEIKTKTLKTKTIIWSGIIAGLAFMMVEMFLLGTFTDQNIFNPPRMMAAIVMGKGVLPSPGSGFNMGVMSVAMMVHLALSLVYAGILSIFISNMKMGLALFTGAVFGLVLYLVNFYGFTALFPWFAMARNWMSILSHIMFGVVAAGVMIGMRKPEEQFIEVGNAEWVEKKQERVREKVEF
jgi:hypothetical protein